MSREFQATKVKKKSRVKKVLKWFAITFLIILIALVSLPFIFKDKLVEVFKTEVNNNVNAQVDFGDFDLTLFSSFPNFTFNIKDLSVIGVNEFEGVNLASIKNTSIELDLMSVINGAKIKVQSIIVDEPIINVVINKDSLANYNIAKSSAEVDTIKIVESEEPLQYEIGLSKLTINKANLSYTDAISNVSSVVKNMDFDLAGDFTQDIFDVTTKTSIEELTVSEGVVDYLNKTKVNLDAAVNIDKFTKYTLKDNKLSLNQLDLGFDGWVELLEEKMNLDLKFDSKKTDFKSILSLIPSVYSQDFNNIDTKGKIALNGEVKGSLEGESYPAFNLDLGITDGYFKYPEMPNSADNINIKTKITHPQGNLDRMKIDVSKLHLELADNPIDATLQVSNPMTDPNITSRIKADIELDKLKTVIPMKENERLNGSIHADLDLQGKVSTITNEQYQDFKADGELTVKNMLYASKELPYEVNVNNMIMDFSPQFVDLKELDTKIGNSDMKAVGRIDNILPYIFNNEVLKGTVQVTSDKLDVDDLMRTVPSEKTTATVTESPDSVTEAFKVPAFYDMNLTTDIKELIYDGLLIKNVRGKVGMNNQIADLTNVSMDMLDGNVVLNGSYDSNNENPKIDFDYKVKNVDIQKTAAFFGSIETLAPVAKHCQGKITTNLKISSELDQNLSPIYSTINGAGGLFSDNLKVKGVKALQKIASILKMDKLSNQSFDKVKMVFQLKDGRA
ncbi:MAG: AsmA-like C-terminal region-containing protein, partial [Flavobacteriales bacterium]